MLTRQCVQARDAKPSKPARCLRFIPDRLIPSTIVLAVIIAILLLVPILGWLATANMSSTMTSTDSHLTEVVIPSYWALPNQPTTSARLHKPKHPLPTGVHKMTTFGPPFSLDFSIDDASTSANSSSLLPITMDSVFDGTFSSASRTLQWCPEGERRGAS